MARTADLQFQLKEDTEGVIVVLKNHGDQFSINYKNPRKIKVKGFNKEPIATEFLHTRAKEEADFFSEGEIGFLKKFIESQDAQIFEQIIEIRRAIRKATKYINAKQVAVELLNEVNHT